MVVRRHMAHTNVEVQSESFRFAISIPTVATLNNVVGDVVLYVHSTGRLVAANGGDQLREYHLRIEWESPVDNCATSIHLTSHCK